MTTHAVPNHSPGADPGRRSVGKVVLASLIGTAIEWYDFFLFGSAAALVFGEVFFGQIGGTEGTLYAFMHLRPRLRGPPHRWRRLRPLR